MNFYREMFSFTFRRIFIYFYCLILDFWIYVVVFRLIKGEIIFYFLCYIISYDWEFFLLFVFIVIEILSFFVNFKRVNISD